MSLSLDGNSSWLSIPRSDGAENAVSGGKAGTRHLQSNVGGGAPLRKAEWVVYAKRPFSGPEAVLAYLSRCTHRVAIANSRLIAFDDQGVTFKWRDYRIDDRDLSNFVLDRRDFDRLAVITLAAQPAKKRAFE